MSDVNWWLMLLSFILGALITWFWMVRRATREVPRTVVDRDRDFSVSTGAKVAGGAGLAAAGAAGASALRDRDVDLDVDRPATEVYDRTVDTKWDAPDVDAPAAAAPVVDTTWDAPDVDVPDVDAPTVQRSSLDLPDVDAPDVDAPSVDASFDRPSFERPDLDAPELDVPDVEAPTVARSSLDLPDVDVPDVDVPEVEVPDVNAPSVGGAVGGAAAAGAAGLGAATWGARSDDVDDISAEPSTEPVRFADRSERDADTDVDLSSEAEVIEAEADLETPAAPTGEADWSTSTGADADIDELPVDEPEVMVEDEPVVEPEAIVRDEPSESIPPVETDVESADADLVPDAPTSSGAAVGAAGAAGLAGAGAFAAGRFGKGSADAGPDGSGPSGWTIKGNEDSMLFHTQESPYYGRTRAEVWFEDEGTARKAGFVRWDEKDRAGRAGGAAKLVAIPEGKFGKGSADPSEDGSGPEGWTIKGNEDSNLFHTQESPYYGRTKAEIWFDSEESARGAGFVRWDERDRSGAGAPATLVSIPEGRFGKGSADPAEDGSGPDGWAIKGNENSMLFHTEDSPAYRKTKAEVWFQDEETARKAGFTKWNERSR
ncbi:hypothetical protein N802_12955 [Knoellia sinensis KCTC 19936]|uniref:Uncharacterized protein n=1 Tax=Knoellia sinensis KCTC 19936 TaxID=1385520 RepID=A0A0A0JBS3_9MICO|nr:hypothetical protein [Knoellia sinensis]KGN34264.1 hypothetical protein N802_12955 [Knoellia sinensis KCTC 19936]